MFKSINIQTIGGILLLVMVLLAGCSGSEDDKQFTSIRQTVDTAAAKIAEDIVQATFASAGETRNFVELHKEEIKPVAGVNEILVADSILYAAGDNGLIAYNFTDQSTGSIGSGKQFKAMAFHDGNLYVGGDRLYIVKNNILEPVELQFEGKVTSLLSDSFRLLIGTENGLIAKGINGEEKLLDDVSVNCMKFDKDGLWVGTNGQGLYRWNGDRFLKRYLIRDTTIFDYVYDIDFNHDHLFVGAATGFFVFDGGSWTQWTTEMGLPSDKVNTIDASAWMVYIGTDNGVISYFNNNLFPVKKLETTPADVVRLTNDKLIVADQNGGVFIKRGYTIKTLIEPIETEKEENEVFTQADENN